MLRGAGPCLLDHGLHRAHKVMLSLKIQQPPCQACVRHRAQQVILPSRDVLLVARDEVGDLLHGVHLARADVDGGAVDAALVTQDEGASDILHVNKIPEILATAFDYQGQTFAQSSDELTRDNRICTLRWIARPIDHEEPERQGTQAVDCIVGRHCQLTHVLRRSVRRRGHEWVNLSKGHRLISIVRRRGRVHHLLDQLGLVRHLQNSAGAYCVALDVEGTHCRIFQ
mmetsp:Transcript_80549/g.231240  ORF Transcript_80549/g.231240 Transcript_80549/m.231240 type:complete len:227 (+) Transcript_80549:567-1247(+)